MRQSSGLSLALFVGATACAVPPPAPPQAEFLVSASDATYWVQSGTRGFHIRRSPIILARAAGKFYELYVEEIDRSYANALFTGERVYRRDIATGDSAVIFEDTAVLRRSFAYHRQHPELPALDPNEDPELDPEYTVEGETDILNVLGPYVALEHRLSVDRGVVTRDDTSETVIDVRSGKSAEMRRVADDPASRESSGVPDDAGRRWMNKRYDVLVRADTIRKVQSVILRDPRGREWRLGMLKSPYMQVFWLDNPKLDAHTRSSLMRAFNEATTYGEPVQLVINRRIPAARTHLIPVT